MKQIKIFYLFFLIIFLPTITFGQITASKTVGCAPLVNVSFTSPPGGSNINWNFDDGASSNLASPVHTFISPGIYNVVYTAVIGGNNVNYSITITVYGNPISSFSATPPLSGCVPLPKNFTDASTGGGGSAIVSREWAFGDGGINVGNNSSPNYTYTVPGAFTVSLKVTDAHGCDTSYSKINYINTSIPPNAVITTLPAPPASCLPPLMVSFSAANSTSNSTTGSSLSYLWNFGGGNTSTVLTPPAINYTNSGVFPISLTVTDNNNCPKTVNNNVVIAAPVAAFNAVGAVNDTVCPTVTFHNTSTGVNPIFNYGDGSFGTDTIHTYAPGTYQVTLQVQAGTCFDDTVKTIIVENVVSLFTSTPTYSCSWPLSVQYTNQSINASTYSWIFGDSLVSTIKNPVHIYTEADTNQYTIYYDPWVYVTSLEVTSVHGCKGFYFNRDTVWKPTARFMPDKRFGCAPLTVFFSDSSISKEPIVSRLWRFGDGATSAGNSLVVNHTYNLPGIYNVTLIITNSAGCKDTSYIVAIYVGEPSTPAFSVSPTTICVNTPVQFTNLTPAADSAHYWHYNADGGIMSSCYLDPSPIWSFNTVTGLQNITLTTVYNGCEGSTTIPNAINIKGPLAHFYPAGNCATPFIYVMHSDIQDATFWTWNFGDGVILNNSTNTTPSHTYTSTGDFNVVLTAFNNSTGCAPYSDSAIVNVRNINASITGDSLVCAGDSTVFPAGLSQDVYQHCNSGYTYYWNDGTPPYVADHSVGHVFTNGGAYGVTVVVKDINGCIDSAKRVVNVYGIQAGFVPSKLYGCMPLMINFTDTTLSDTTITQWQWNFGDNTTSNLQNPSHTFTQPGVYYWIVKLVVTSALGCKDSISVIVRPSIPDSSYFVLTPANICTGDSVSFSANSPIVTYSWNFGNNTFSTIQSPVGHFPLAGNFNVVLTVTDSIGCKTSSSSIVNVQNYPLAGFESTADTLFNKCYPLLVNFTDTSIVNIFGSRTWNLGNGSSTIGTQTVGTIYGTPGTYTVTLIETTTNGCSDTLSKNIIIEGPVGNFNIVPDSICKGQSITFSIKDTSDVLNYSWDFGDGITAPGTSPITHFFNINPVSGQTTVSLVMWSPDSACTATRSNQIYIYPIVADYSITNNDTIYCLNEPIIFNNLSLNAGSSHWSFGDGTVYNGTTPPQHIFPSAGTYSISLAIANNSSGCFDTLIRNLTILDIPTAVASGGDTCQGSSVQITSGGGLTYLWTPATGLSNDSISNPIANPLVTTNYTVVVTDINGCTDDAIASVIIYEPPVEVHFDTLMVIGDSVQLYVYSGPGYTYQWTPSLGLSCTSCYNPWAMPLVNTIYSVTIQDSAGCFSVTSTYDFEIKPITTIDVPTGFTPDGDGINDIIYVDGLGIKKLIEFKIYNRWGQLVFETNDIHKGWNGFYRGELQNVETYVYFASVETWLNGEILTKKGSFNLLR